MDVVVVVLVKCGLVIVSGGGFGSTKARMSGDGSGVFIV